MSNLQIGLAIVGGLVLAGVVAQGAWASRRSEPRQATPQEPTDSHHPAHEGIEPGLGDAAFDVAHFPVPVVEKRPVLDSLIDVIAPIALDSLVYGDAALAAMPPTRRVGSKPFAIEGLNEESNRWETPAVGQRYSAFQTGVQLANRTGALNEIEYSEFVIKTQSFSDAVGGTPDFPEMLDEVARARELDQFASAHDAQLDFFVRARQSAWSPGYVQQNAALLGFVAGAMPGRMVLPASAAGPHAALSLTFDSQAALAADPTQTPVHECALTLDVPQVLRAEQAFERLQHAALVLAHGMGATITDGAGQVLSPEAMALIAQDLEHLYDAFEQRELPAGSALARRLFA